MTSGRIALSLFAVLAADVWLSVALGGTGAQQNPETFIFSQCPEVGARLSIPGGLETLLNPTFRTQAQIEAAVTERRDMLACLESVRFRTVLPDWFGILRYNLELFLSFAVVPPGSDAALELIDLTRTDDPAVQRLREDVGLAPPAGMVLVRSFRTREAMPENIRQAFDDPETQAVTMSSRYVAVMTGEAVSPGAAVQSSLQSTVSHEMVHAFLNAGLVWGDGARRFPSWFHEGMAIHFSGSGRAHVSMDPSGGRIRIAPISEYERYERVFLYLENELGAAALNRAIRAVVSQVDTAPLLAAAGVATYDDLVRDAELWWRWWPIPVAFVEGRNIWLSGGLLLLLLVVGARMWRRWQPAVAGSSLEVNLNNDLIGAVRSGDLEEVQYLLRSGASPNARDEARWTALLWAVWLGRSAIAEQLVDQGARVTAEIREATAWRDDPDIERVVADAATRQREVW